MTYTEAITLSVAVLGAALGVINTWQSLSQNRLRLRVTPKHALPFGNTPEHINFCIEVINRSYFPVTITEVGVLYSGTTNRGAYISPIIPDGRPWPRRLEPRESVTVYGQKPDKLDGHSIRCAYAQTDCGERITGNSAALKQISRGH